MKEFVDVDLSESGEVGLYGVITWRKVSRQSCTDDESCVEKVILIPNPAQTEYRGDATMLLQMRAVLITIYW